MPDIPSAAIMAAAIAIERELLSGKDYSMAQDSDEALARAALEAAAPLLAEAWGGRPDDDEPAAPMPGHVGTEDRAMVARATGGGIRSRELHVKLEDAAEDEPWWCDCRDRKGPHVHMPNWGGQGGSIALTALVDIKTGMEIPGSRKAGSG